MRRSNRSAGPSLSELSDEEFKKHVAKDVYGDLRLSDGVRPCLNARLQQGYRIELHNFSHYTKTIPLVVAAISREKIFDLFMELTEEIGEDVGVALESYHHIRSSKDRKREWVDHDHSDNVVVRSILIDHEDLLVNDGCTSISIFSGESTREVSLNEDKIIVTYNWPVDSMRIMDGHGLKNYPHMQIIGDREHMHSSTEKYREEFHELRGRLIGDEDEE